MSHKICCGGEVGGRRLSRSNVAAILAILWMLNIVPVIAAERDFSVKPTGQESPIATLTKMMGSLFEGDYKSFDECVYQGPVATKAFYDCIQKCGELRHKLKEKYGDDGWTEFNETRVRGLRIDLTHTQPEQDKVLAALKEDIRFERKNDLAICTLPWSGAIQVFRQMPNGAWYIDYGADSEEVAVAWSSLQAGVDKVMAMLSDDAKIIDLKTAFEDERIRYFKEAVKLRDNKKGK